MPRGLPAAAEQQISVDACGYAAALDQVMAANRDLAASLADGEHGS